MREELRNRFSWSHSRHESFRTCPRRCYYHYYGSWNGWRADADPLARRLYLLKQLKARALWAGAHVHATIAGLLGSLREGAAGSWEAPGILDAAGGDPAERAIEETIARMRGEFRASRAGDYLRDPRRVMGLLEHHYGEPVTDAEWRAVADGVRAALAAFFHGPHLAALTRLDRDAWLALEDLDEFPVDGVPVYVKLDLALRLGDGRVRVLDWKTGRGQPRAEGLQFGVYALYAAQRWGVAPGSIEIAVVNLNAGGESVVTADAHRLEASRAAISASIAAMRARLRDAADNLADPADFPAHVAARSCGGCAFREACPEYRAAFGTGGLLAQAAAPLVEP